MITLTTDSRGVATLTLNRPEKHNALDGETLRRFHDALVEIENDADVRAVILTGAGGSFSAGSSNCASSRFSKSRSHVG